MWSDGLQWVHLCPIRPVISLNCDDVVCKKKNLTLARPGPDLSDP